MQPSVKDLEQNEPTPKKLNVDGGKELQWAY